MSGRRPRSLSDQRLVYDDIWRSDGSSGNTQSNPAVPYAVTSDPASKFTFVADTGAKPDARGLRGLRVTQLKYDGMNILDTLAWRDVAAILDDGSVVPFDFDRAFANTTNPPQWAVSSGGTLAGDVADYPWGLRLQLYDDLGGRCPVDVVFSLVLKNPVHNIDPGGTVRAIKLFPQMAFRCRSGGAHVVAGFRATTWMLINSWRAVDPAEMPGMSGDMTGMPQRNTAAFFVDTNYSVGVLVPTLMTRLVSNGRPEKENMESILDWPFYWQQIFDYHQPDVTTEREFVGVYSSLGGPDITAPANLIPPDPRGLKSRSQIYRWNYGDSGSDYRHTVKKVSRQGAYDNMHIHAYMGLDEDAPGGAPMSMVHAPGCAEACFHIHWRWGALATPPLIGPANPEDFSGWSDYKLDDLNPRSGDDQNGPMIPPNQQLTIALTTPDRARSSPLSTLIDTPGTLDQLNKAFWYTVDVRWPGADEWQVCFDHGASWAFEYTQPPAPVMTQIASSLASQRPDLFGLSPDAMPLWKAWLSQLDESPDDDWVGMDLDSLPPPAPPPPPDPMIMIDAMPVSKWIHYAYRYYRWFFDDSGKALKCQIPTGDYQTMFNSLIDPPIKPEDL
jgi:hypothetical protein